jgi:hypothetical protein
MFSKFTRRSKLLALSTLTCGSLILSACGGGSSSTPSSSSAVVVGTAAYGAAVANATVRITDRSGASACTNDPITTDANGAYRCNLSSSSQAPFAVLVTDPDNLVNPMISILSTKPAVGSETTANVTPITTAIAAQLDTNKDPFALIKDPASLANVNTATLATIKANVVQQLADVLSDAGVNPATFDPISTPFTGGNRTGVDKMLDQVRVTFDNGAPQLSNALNPNAPSVPLAGTSSAPMVTVSAITGTFTLAELDFAKTELERCFAVPAATRAPNPDTVNRRLNGVAPECENFVASAGDAPNVDIDFKNNGYSPEAYFYGLLTSSDMDGAKVNLPELLRYVPRNDGRDEALLNIKFRDKNGFIDNRILNAKKFPGSRTTGTQWWLIGNQRNFDVFIRSSVRQREQMIAQSVLDGTTTFNNAARSRFETGLEIFIQRPNNGGTVNYSNNPNGGMRYVRVKGPGLPTAGLVYADVASGLPQSWMGILNATGTIPNDTTSTQQFAGANGVGVTSNIFNIQRTVGITGTQAFTIRPNPNQTNANQAINTPQWAHPAMYGDTPSSTWTFNLSQAPAWSLYTFEVFNNTSTTPDSTFTARILTPVMPAPYAATQQWHSYTAASRALVSDGAVATSSVDIAWTPNSLAERIGTVNAYSFSASGQINSASLGVPKGVFTRNAPASSGQFPAISISSNQNGRTLQIRHSMLDGSYKDHLIQFN